MLSVCCPRLLCVWTRPSAFILLLIQADRQHIIVSQATPLCKGLKLVAHVAFDPQVEFELLEGIQQQKTSWRGIR